MGLFNILHVPMHCPSCDITSPMEVETFFGLRDQTEYHLGDVCEWFPRKQPQNGGRPEGGNLDGEGYTECPRCQKDFFVVVHIRADVFAGVEVDTQRTGYIPHEPQ